MLKGLKPVSNRIIVIPVLEKKSKGGIILPDVAVEKQKEKPLIGYVIAIGEMDKDEKLDYQVGDRIIFNQYASTNIRHNEKDYLLMLKTSVLAVFTDVSDDERKQYLG